MSREEFGVAGHELVEGLLDLAAQDDGFTDEVTALPGELLQFDNAEAALKAFDGEKLDAYAGLRPGLIDLQKARPGARILDGQFTAVQQAVGTARTNSAGAAFLRDFVEEAKKSGLVARLIERHKVTGRLSVAPAA